MKSSEKIVRIGGASAFLGDASIATPQLLRSGQVDYLIFDYLAEVTMGVLGQLKKRDMTKGYADHFASIIVTENLQDILARKVKIVTNAGGVNPLALRDKLKKISGHAGASLKIAVVLGDDLTKQEATLRERGCTEMFSGKPMPTSCVSINAYLGAKPIAEALRAGADIVLTGRVVDSALTLGILMHEFAWTTADLDLMAAGTLAGHVIECGAQATGGLFTDWEQVPGWENIGYPIIECHGDGSFVVTKPEGTGGLVTPATVGEQILYEIADPQAYVVPDAACDFSGVQLTQIGANRVRVAGAKGSGLTDTYKVCAVYEDGYRATALSGFVGIDAAKKAQRTAEAMLARTRTLFRERKLGDYSRVSIETMGAEASYGPHARAGARASREVLLKVGVEHDDERAIALLQREWLAPATSMSPGTTMWLAGPATHSQRVVRLFSCLLPKHEIEIEVDFEGERWSVAVPSGVPLDRDSLTRPHIAAYTGQGTTVRVPVIALAHGRSGDKGDNANIGIIARQPEFLGALRNALTVERVREHFAYCGVTQVERWDLPGFDAMNFLLHNALGGGGSSALHIDPLAKGFAQRMLDMEIEVPEGLAKVALAWTGAK
jgi:hypothetical protein